jgi:DNA polymerase-3 subunit epsilon
VPTCAPLAFVDVETTGLSPTENRIAEIGVVTVDGERVDRWTTLLKTSPRRESASPAASTQPTATTRLSFATSQPNSLKRLSGRLLVAHNARFDHAFLAAEFDRVGIAFNPDVVCSVMLSRRLYPHLTHHDLDSLASVTGCARRRGTARCRMPISCGSGGRSIHRQCSADAIADTIAKLLAGPCCRRISSRR